MTPSREQESGHLTAADLAAYLDGTLGPSARARVEAHLADCDACLDEVTVLDGLVHEASARPRARWRVAIGIGVAAAAVLAFLVAFPPGGAGPGDQLRAPEPEAQPLRALEPLGQLAASGELVLRWEGPGEAALYRVVLLDSIGTALWTSETRESRIRIPSEVRERLVSGARYFWRADALLPDLRTVTTGDQPFTLRP